MFDASFSRMWNTEDKVCTKQPGFYTAVGENCTERRDDYFY